MTLQEALKKAAEQGLDLIEITTEKAMSVCKIDNYSKWKYILEQKEKRKTKTTKNTSIKEVQFSLKIADKDYDTKLKHILHFLEKQHSVKLSLSLIGREQAKPEAGVLLIEQILASKALLFEKHTPIMKNGRKITTVITPKTTSI